jgi:hypothetical protein
VLENQVDDVRDDEGSNEHSLFEGQRQTYA